MNITNILLCGVGGQGILTQSRLLAQAAAFAGLDVKVSEVHGMSQRGGNVETHVRIGPIVPSCIIPKGGAHFMVACEKLEALRNLDYMRPDGVVIASPLEICPVSLSLKKNSSYPEGLSQTLKRLAPALLWVDADAEAVAVGDRRTANVVLLGALSQKLGNIADTHWEAAIRGRFKPALQERCLAAFARGAALARAGLSAPTAPHHVSARDLVTADANRNAELVR